MMGLLGFWEGLSGERKWVVLRRFEGEKVTVVEILGGFWDDCEGSSFEGDLGLGAKKREIICCFCFPMVMVVCGLQWWSGE